MHYSVFIIRYALCLVYLVFWLLLPLTSKNTYLTTICFCFLFSVFPFATLSHNGKCYSYICVNVS